MNVKRLLTSPFGKIIISVLLGLGLASLFQKACRDGSCINFNGPVINEIDGKTYKFGEICYQYKLEPDKYDPLKQTVTIDDTTANFIKANEKDNTGVFGLSLFDK